MSWLTRLGDYCEDIGWYFDAVVDGIEAIPGLPNWFGNPFGYIRNKFYRLTYWFYKGDEWIDYIMDLFHAVGDSLIALWDWRDIIESWIDTIDTWWDDLVTFISDKYNQVRAQVSTEISRINYVWDNAWDYVTDTLGDDWDDLVLLLDNWEEWVSDSILGAYSSLDSWFDDQENRVFGWVEDRRSTVMDWVDDRKEDIQGWAEERILTLGADAQAAVYGFVITRIDDLEERIRESIEKKIETTAAWWWALGEKILDRV